MFICLSKAKFSTYDLGLDPSQYRSRAPVEEAEEQDTRDEDRFLSCTPFTTACVCGEEVVLDGPFKGSGKAICPALLVCPQVKPCGGFPLQVIGPAIDLCVYPFTIRR